MRGHQERPELTLRAAAKLPCSDTQEPAAARRCTAPRGSGAKARSEGHAYIVLLVLAALGLEFAHATQPRLLFNASPSVPIGLYWLDVRRPVAGDLAAVSLSEPMRNLADARGYLPAGTLLIKPVAAHTGDLVCRFGGTVTINGRFVAVARARDRSGGPMPRWTGCGRVPAGQVFVLSDAPSSFDSRYFGGIARRLVLGTARPIWQAGLSY